MIFWEDFNYSDQLVLLNSILMIEAIPDDVFRSSLIQNKFVNVDSNIKSRLLLKWRGHYRAVAWWLKVLVLGIYKPLPYREFEAFVDIFSNAIFSIAKLEWALSTHKILPFTHEQFSSPTELWYMMEFSDFNTWLELTGISGSPALNGEGRLLGKAEGLELDIAALKACKENFRQVQKGAVEPEDLDGSVDASFEPTLTEALLSSSLYWLNKVGENDNELYSACMKFLDAKLRLQRLARKKQHSETQSVFYLVSPNQLFAARKGIKTPRPNFAPKRGRGRPPKGNNVKKC